MKTRLRVLKFLKTYYKKNGYAPKFREFMSELKISSTSVVSFHLKKLEVAGLITQEKGVPRSAKPVIFHKIRPQMRPPRKHARRVVYAVGFQNSLVQN